MNLGTYRPYWGDCECLSSDSTGAYVHDLLLPSCGRDSGPVLEGTAVAEALDSDSVGGDMDFSRSYGLDDSDMRRPGSVPFVSHRPGAYGRLLLAVYVRWRTGLLVASDWLRPVMRGGWRMCLVFGPLM